MGIKRGEDGGARPVDSVGRAEVGCMRPPGSSYVGLFIAMSSRSKWKGALRDGGP